MHFYDNCFYCRPDNPYFILRMCDIIESTFHLLLLSTFSLCFSMNLAETKIGPKITKQKNFSARHKVVTVVRSRQDMAAWTLFAPTSSLFGQKTYKRCKVRKWRPLLHLFYVQSLQSYDNDSGYEK